VHLSTFGVIQDGQAQGDATHEGRQTGGAGEGCQEQKNEAHLSVSPMK
jgi:hypothetical protein